MHVAQECAAVWETTCVKQKPGRLVPTGPSCSDYNYLQILTGSVTLWW